MKKVVDYRGVLLFLLLSFSGAWLVSLPLWISQKGLLHPFTGLVLLVMMAVPALAVLLVYMLNGGTEKTRLLGLGLGSKGWWRYWVFGWFIVPLFAIFAPFMSSAFGLYTLDVQDFSGFKELLASGKGGVDPDTVPVRLLVFGQLFSIFLSPVLNAVFVFGEEVGWRGYLLPRLLPLGQWPALLISGIVWGLWHAPVVLLGYNYPQHPVYGVFFMMILCVIFGVLFGWTRLATGSIWPAVIAHGALNGSAGVMYLFSKAGTTFDTAHAGITGWTGWILPVLWILILLVTRRLPVSDPPDERHLSFYSLQGPL